MVLAQYVPSAVHLATTVSPATTEVAAVPLGRDTATLPMLVRAMVMFNPLLAVLTFREEGMEFTAATIIRPVPTDWLPSVMAQLTVCVAPPPPGADCVMMRIMLLPAVRSDR